MIYGKENMTDNGKEWILLALQGRKVSFIQVKGLHDTTETDHRGVNGLGTVCLNERCAC